MEVTSFDPVAIPIVEGPVIRSGERIGGTDGESIYIRDPNKNLLEFFVYP